MLCNSIDAARPVPIPSPDKGVNVILVGNCECEAREEQRDEEKRREYFWTTDWLKNEPSYAIQPLFATLFQQNRTRNGWRCPYRTIAEPLLLEWTLCKAVVSIAYGGTYYEANQKSKLNIRRKLLQI